MTAKATNVTLTEEEIKQIASGKPSIALRKKLGLEALVITVTKTYELIYTESNPLTYADEEGEEYSIFTVEALDKAYQENADSIDEAVLYDCDEEGGLMSLAFGDKVVQAPL